jgi:virginiamycin A acetyltransferase
MILSENSFSVKIKIDDVFLKLLKRKHVYTYRGGLNRRTISAYNSRFKNGDVITIQKDAIIEPFSTYSSGKNLYSLGSFSSSASELPIRTKVGRYSSIGQNVKVMGFRHPVEAVTTSSVAFNFFRENIHPYFELVKQRDGIELAPVPVSIPQPNEKPIIIGNDVWIGSDVVLNGGINIGDGAVIAGGAVVTKDVEPYSIVGGVSAKLIKYRFPLEIRTELGEARWWDYELADLYALDFSSPEIFLQNLKLNESNLRMLKLEKLCLKDYLAK